MKKQFVMIVLPAGCAPAGWKPPEPAAAGSASGMVNFMSGEMMKRPQFYMARLTFLFS